MSAHEDRSEDIVFDPAILAGAWADTRMFIRADELTVDFVRRIPGSSERMLVLPGHPGTHSRSGSRAQLHEAWQGHDGWPMTERDRE